MIIAYCGCCLLCWRGIGQVNGARIIIIAVAAIIILPTRSHWSSHTFTSRGIRPSFNDVGRNVVIVGVGGGCDVFKDRCTVASTASNGTSAAAFELGFAFDGCR